MEEVVNKLYKYLEEAYDEAQTVRAERHKKTVDLAVNGFTESDVDEFLLCGIAMGRVITYEEMKIVIGDIVKEITNGKEEIRQAEEDH